MVDNDMHANLPDGDNTNRNSAYLSSGEMQSFSHGLDNQIQIVRNQAARNEESGLIAEAVLFREYEETMFAWQQRLRTQAINQTLPTEMQGPEVRTRLAVERQPAHLTVARSKENGSILQRVMKPFSHVSLGPRLTLIGTAAFVAAFGLIYIYSGISTVPQFEFSSASPDSQIMFTSEAGQLSSANAGENIAVEEGDTIKVEGFADLDSGNEWDVRLVEASVEVSGLDENGQINHLVLNDGQAFITVDNLDIEDADVEIETDAVIARAEEGASFIISSNADDGSTYVAVESGEVTLDTEDGQSIIVSAGQEIEVMPGQDMALKPITESELFDNFRQGTLATTPSKSSRTVASSTISQGAGTQYSSVIKSNGNQAATTPTPSPTRTATATVSAAVAIATENKSVFTNSQPESPLSSVALLSDSAQSTATPIPNSIGESFNSTDTMVALEDASVDESTSTHSGQLESPLALPVSPGGYTSSAASAEYEEDTGSSGSELEGTKWVLKEAVGSAELTSLLRDKGRTFTIQFLARGRLSGIAACVNFLGLYDSKKSNKTIRILSTSTTSQPECERDAVDKDRAFVRTLKMAQKYLLTKSTFTIQSENNVSLVFAQH